MAAQRKILTLKDIKQVLSPNKIDALKAYKKANEKLFKHAVFNSKSNKDHVAAFYFFAAIFSNDYDSAKKVENYISTDVINAYLINSNSLLFHVIKQGLDSKFCSLLLNMDIEYEDSFFTKVLLQLSPSKKNDLAVLKIILNDIRKDFSTESYLPSLFTGELKIKSVQDKELFIPLLLSAGCCTDSKPPIINSCDSERLKLCKLWLELGSAIEALENYAKSEQDQTAKTKIQTLAKDLRREIMTIVETNSIEQFKTVLHRFDNDKILGERSALKIALINIGLCLIGLGAFYVAAGLINMAVTGGRHFLFFKQSEGQEKQEAIQIAAEAISVFEPG